ncbi:MAG: efflux RND transporter periplasmic adaptor subunit [Lachnospiraceae bacterium]|nr:efflux RND transporter periplasmic adaptor subunit [Lachnospiraceae bacterium]
MNNKKFISKILMYSALASIPIVTVGCSTPAAEDPLIVLENGDDEANYTLVQVTRDDVYSTAPLKCVYKKEEEQEVYFPVSGKLIDKVYVSEGDEVKKGDILVELSVGSLKSDIADLEYRIKRNEMLLGYVDEEDALDRQNIYLNYMFGTSMSDDDKEKLNKNLDNLTKANDLKKQGYNDSLEFDRKELAALKAEYANSRVYAQFDGKVSKIAENLEGSTSNVEKCIMTIVDNAEGFFITEDSTLAGYFTEGEAVNMRISSGSGKGNYELVPYDMDSWNEIQTFRILTGENTDSLEAGDKGEMTVITDKREGVLCLPSDCVRSAGEDTYVYVVNDENLREVVWVKTGLSGNGKTEIVSGLSEGENVIKS